MSKINLRNTPFLAVTIPFIAGIILCSVITRPAPVAMCIVGGVILFLVAAAIDIVLKKNTPLILTGFLILGFTTAWLGHKEPEVPQQQRIQFISRVETIPLVKGKWKNTQARITAYKDSMLGWVPVSEKTLLSIDTSQNVAIGETVTYDARLYPIDSTYGKYMANRNVYSRSYTYRIEKLYGDTSLLDKINIRRNVFSDKLNATDTSCLTSALTLGDKRELSRTLRKEYSLSGTAHLLAVSGLHVGIIFAILNIMLGWIRIYRRGLVITGCFIITILWGYAVVTGMSPSVLRAVIMFTLFQIGIMTSRTGSSLNILAASAFLLLLWNPQNLYDIGFQMSYMAMVGITTLYRPFYSLLNPKLLTVRWLWGLTVVSLTAQIGVVPLVVYYFGQLPLVGLLISPIVWFTVPVIIIGGFAYLASGWVWLGDATACVASLQNSIISWTASHKWIAIENISMPLWLVWAIYAVILVLIMAVNNDPLKTAKSTLRTAKRAGS